MSKAPTNKELLNNILGTIQETFKTAAVQQEQTRLYMESMESKVEMMDRKIDSLMNKIDLLSGNKLPIDRLQFENQVITVTFKCGCVKNLTRKQYILIESRCKELQIPVGCVECSKNLAHKIYAKFVEKFGRLPNAKEVNMMVELRKERLAEERRALVQAETERKRAEYLLTYQQNQ